MMRAMYLAAVSVSLLSAPVELRAEGTGSWPEFRCVPKPTATAEPIRARLQPSVPEGYRELPFEERAPEPELVPAEAARGYLLFQRPITEPVYSNSHPLPHERLEELTAFATVGELEPVCFSVYPVRDLVDFRVRVSPLDGPAGRIGAGQVTVRLVTYWNIGYPRYTSRETYRRLPELLERVTVHSSPARECQRWWLLVHVPETAPPGVYRGTVTVWDAGFAEAVEIPLTVRVLGFRLLADPGKHYSAYYNVRNAVQYGDRDEAFVQKATGNEYRAMVDYGLDMLPTSYLTIDDVTHSIVIRDAEEIERMLAAGLRGPLPVTGDSVIGRLYREMTPGGKTASHWAISKLPPPAFYERVTEAFRTLDAERRARGWPDLVCCPLDEVAASHQEFGSRVYKAVHDAGIRTYATKDPLAADATSYHPYVDVWCSQPYSTPYEKIIAQDRYEYWCYPNHNAGEIKDRRTMCKGGRMTYGFGFWRSGFTTLIPWHWAWTPRPDQFDYLRGTRSGCGQRIGDDGEVIPAIYWECFREGRDDGRYLYTLQQAIFERDGVEDARCRQAVADGKALLQETWDAIRVQSKYLADGMWPSGEFNARRWRLACMIATLREFPAVRSGTAPSVLLERIEVPARDTGPPLVEQAMARRAIESRDLGEGFAEWRNETGEGAAEVTPAAGRESPPGLRWTVTIDHATDGGEGGTYPVGWPRIRRTFAPGSLDLRNFDYLELVLRVNSDRDENTDDTTPLGLSIGAHRQRRLYETTLDLGDRQNTWIPVRLPIRNMIESAGSPAEVWEDIAHLQLFISERNYRDGTRLVFDVASVRLLRLTAPQIVAVAVPRYAILPSRQLAIDVEIVGERAVRPGSHVLKARVVDRNSATSLQIQQDLTRGGTVVLDCAALPAGAYRVETEISAADGTLCARAERQIELLAPTH